jgi:diaminopimelate epimerase
MAANQANFYKYQALGNDMLVIDPNQFDLPLSPANIRLLCHRHFGLGADGVCLGPLIQSQHPRHMRFFNPDGSESGKSGNGLRIFARYLWDYGYVKQPTFDIWINRSTVNAEIKDKAAHSIAIAMGQLSFNSPAIPVTGPAREVVEEIITIGEVDYTFTAVTIGNPHCVIFADEISEASTRAVGQAVELAPSFPQRTNVQFVKVLDQHTLQIEIWERGAGYTLASGTSSCAAAGAALKTGRCLSPVKVRMAGGTATVEIDQSWGVILTGEVQAVSCGQLAADLIAKLEIA